jgi:hypothetical protein
MNEVGLASGAKVLFSYQTPVAYIDSNNVARRTSKFWSRTTSRHINQWIGSLRCEDLPQEWFDNLLNVTEEKEDHVYNPITLEGKCVECMTKHNEVK